MGEGGSGGGRRGIVEFEGRVRVVVARPDGGSRAIGEALACEEVCWVGAAQDVHYPVLVLCKQVEPASLVMT